MLDMIGYAVFGLVVGVVAKLLLPGHDPGGLVVTAIIGMAGGWFGWIGRTLGWYAAGFGHRRQNERLVRGTPYPG